MSDDHWPEITPAPEDEDVREDGIESDTDADDVFSNAIFGPAILAERADPHSAVAFLLSQWRRDAIDALNGLLWVDLNSTVGVERARNIQADAQRYFDMSRRLDQAVADMEKQVRQAQSRRKRRRS